METPARFAMSFIETMLCLLLLLPCCRLTTLYVYALVEVKLNFPSFLVKLQLNELAGPPRASTMRLVGFAG